MRTFAKIVLVSTCDSLSCIALKKIFEGNKPYKIAGIIKTKTSFKFRRNILKKALANGSLFYAVYIQFEIFGAWIINILNHRGFHLSDFFKNIPTTKVNNINSHESVSFIKKINPDIVLSVRPGHIFGKYFISNSPIILNLHCSLLPNYRGIGAIFQTLVNEEEWVGCSVHIIDSEAVDKGDIVAQLKLPKIKWRSVFYHTLLLYKHAGDVIEKAIKSVLCNQLDIIKNEGGSYYSWPSKAELKKLHEKNQKMIQLKDFMLRYSDRVFRIA